MERVIDHAEKGRKNTEQWRKIVLSVLWEAHVSAYLVPENMCMPGEKRRGKEEVKYPSHSGGERVDIKRGGKLTWKSH